MAKCESPAAGLCLVQLEQGTHSHGLLPTVPAMLLGRAEGSEGSGEDILPSKGLAAMPLSAAALIGTPWHPLTAK